MSDELMRFMIVGPAQRGPDAPPRAALAVPTSLPAPGADVPPGSIEADLAALAALAEDPSQVLRSTDNLPFDSELRTLHAHWSASSSDARAPLECIQEVFQQPPQTLITGPAWASTAALLNDSIVAAKVVGAQTAPLRTLAAHLGTVRAVERVALGEIQSIEAVRAEMARPLELPARYARPTLASARPEAAATRRQALQSAVLATAESAATQLSALHRRLDTLRQALHELCAVDQSGVETVCPQGETTEDPRQLENLCRAWQLVARGAAPPSLLTRLIRATRPTSRLRLNAAAQQQLSPETQTLLIALQADPADSDLLTVAGRLRQEQQRVQLAIQERTPARRQRRSAMVGTALVSFLELGHLRAAAGAALSGPWAMALPEAPAGIHEAVRPLWPGIVDGILPLPPGFWDRPRFGGSRLKPRGKGRLYVIRQHIEAYLPGEVSHVENILVGEGRERSHTRRSRLEQFSSTEMEREREEERSLESTDRAELEREVQRTLREKFDAKGGLKVSGSYGVVRFEAFAELAYSRASEESARSAQRLAREVTETAKERVKERVSERRERRRIDEVEEVNSHSFDGSTLSQHRSGVYQWLNKRYRAEVWDHGERTMYDVLVPEPAAGLIHAATHESAPPAGQPAHPGEIPYGVSELDTDKVHELIARYGVTETLPPVPQDRLVSLSFEAHSENDAEKNFFAKSRRLEIPEEYYPASGWLEFKGRREQDGNREPVRLGVIIGPLEHTFVLDNVHTPRPGGSQLLIFPFPSGLGAELPMGTNIDVGVAVDDFSAFVLTVTLLLRPHDEAHHTWKRRAFAAIQQAHAQRLQEWRDAQTVQNFDAASGGDLRLGQNPALNRDIEKAELQRAVIEIMRGRPLDWQLLHDAPPALLDDAPRFPRLDLMALGEAAPEIRFLQQAFEWENLTYALYPYFYGRPAQWSVKVFYRDADPRFAEFLRAGAARVQIPVRPGFEAAVDHYMMTGIPWHGRDEPTIGDDNFLSLFEETLNDLHPDRDAVHLEDRDFDVIVPTSLIQVRPDDSLPRWEKVAGQWREVESPPTP